MVDQYWYISIESILDEMGKMSHFTTKEVEELVEAIEVVRNNESTGKGWDCIPSPHLDEIAKLKKQISDIEHKNEIKFQENEKSWQEFVYRKNCEISDLRHKLSRDEI